MSKLQALGYPIERLKGNIISYKLQTRIPTKQNLLKSGLYISVGAEVMLTSNLCTDAGLKNGAKGTVIDFVCKNAEDPRSGKLAEADVVQFC